MIKLDTRALRRGLSLLCAVALLAGCGLAGGHGSLSAGSKYQAEGKYRAAYIEAKKVLQKNNKSGDAWLLLGQSSLMLGDAKDALNDLHNAKTNGVPEQSLVVPTGRALLVTRQFDELLKTLPADGSFTPEVKARVLVLRGSAQLELKQPQAAQQSYESALKLDPKEPRALVGLARLAGIANNTGSANDYVQRALAAAPDSPQAWIAKGDLAFDNHDFGGAETAYQKALDLKHPDWLPQEHFYTLARLANVQAQRNELDKALTSIKALEKVSPKQPYPHYLHAVVSYKQGHLDDAVSELQQVLKVSPDNAQAQMLMGAVNYAKANYGQAEMYLSNVMGMDSKNVPARKLLALTFYREGRSKQALDTLRPVVPGTPSDAELLAQLQKATAAGAGMPGEAASSGAPASPFTRAGKALVSGNEPEAIRLLQAIPAGNASTEARRTSMLAMGYLREKHPDEAVKVAADYAAKHPKDSAAHLLYGTTLVATGKRKQARAEYSEAYKLDPNSIAALLSMGSLDVLEGHDKDAVGRYQIVLKKDPHNAVAMAALGTLSARKGDKAQAIKWFKQAIAAAPKYPAAYVGLAQLYNQSGKFDEAAGVAKQLVAVDPHNPAAFNALGAAELNAGHHDQALKPLQQAVNLAPQATRFRTNLARAQILNKDAKGAAQNLDEVIKAEPGNVTAVALRAFLKLQDHDSSGALSLAQTLQKQTATKAAGFALEGDLYMANKSYSDAAKAYQQGLKVRYARPLVVKSFQALSASGAKQPERVLQDWLGKHADDAATRLLLAQYYLGHAQNTQAAGEYQRVLKQYPSNIDALNNLAWIYAEQHKPEAVKLAEKAHKLAPDSPGIADTYGWALVANNQPKTALPILEQAAKAAPKLPAIQYHLAVAQARTGDKTGARTTLEALQKSGTDFQDKQAAEKLYKELGGAGGGAGK